MSTYNASNLINLCVNKGLTFSQVCRYEFLFVFVGFVQVLMKLSKIVNVIDLGIHRSLLNILCVKLKHILITTWVGGVMGCYCQ